MEPDTTAHPAARHRIRRLQPPYGRRGSGETNTSPSVCWNTANRYTFNIAMCGCGSVSVSVSVCVNMRGKAQSTEFSVHICTSRAVFFPLASYRTQVYFFRVFCVFPDMLRFGLNDINSCNIQYNMCS